MNKFRRTTSLCLAADRREEGAGGGFFRQRGLTLVEMMVALVISLMLLAGLVTVFGAMNSSFSTTKQLNHLVGQQRLASTVLSNAISGAGYWSLTNRTVLGRYRNSVGAFPAAAITSGTPSTLNFVAGQVIAGSGGTAANAANVIATRMIAAPNGSIFNCQGGQNTGTSIEQWVNVIWVDTTENELMCTVVSNDGSTITSSAVPLLGGESPAPGTSAYGGVKTMSAIYGVDVDANGSVDRYMSAQTLNSSAGELCAEVNGGTGSTYSCWPYVRSARVTLDFVSALDNQRTISMSRNIVLSSAIGLYVKPVEPPVASSS